jgi:hypothetical protein
MSVITTSVGVDIEQHVRDSVLNTLTGHLAMDRELVRACLEGRDPDIRIASRVAIIVIARAQKVFGVKDLVDPKKLRPEQVTSVRNVAALLSSKLRERLG